MRVHFIAIGGAVMHNLAIALHKKGYKVTGSDDEIVEPSRSRLEKYDLLPEATGWHPEKITSDIDTVILGMHARADNPELLKAREKGLMIKSFPEYLYEQTCNKKRIVIAGSHGKTTTTAMIMHVFRWKGIMFDYMAGSQIDGFETMVGLNDNSEIAVFEGDEYLTSPVDRRPKFHLYMPHIAVINGIAWDHMNVFPTFNNYIEQYRIFIEKITDGGTLIYFEEDPVVKDLSEEAKCNIRKIPYRVHGYFQNKTGFYAATHNRVVPLKIFGEHNMQNLSAAREVCLTAGISEDDFYEAIVSFEGTSKRLQKIAENEKGIVYLDFAHAPSKVKASVEAVKNRYPGRKLIACLELHTFSSLSIEFLNNYQGTMDSADSSYVYYSLHALEMRKMKPLAPDDVRSSFGNSNPDVFDDPEKLFRTLKENRYENPVYLFMSSGDFDGHDLTEVIS